MRGLAEVEIFSRATLGRGEGGRYIDLNYCECSRKTDDVIVSPDTVFPLRSAIRFPIPGPEHAELGPGDVRPSLQFELSDKRYQISDIRSVTYNGSVGSPHEGWRLLVLVHVAGRLLIDHESGGPISDITPAALAATRRGADPGGLLPLAPGLGPELCP